MKGIRPFQEMLLKLHSEPGSHEVNHEARVSSVRAVSVKLVHWPLPLLTSLFQFVIYICVCVCV